MDFDGTDWNSEDTQNLRTFLLTRSGAKLIPKLAESAPVLFAEGDTNKVLIRNGQLLGFQQALKEFILLANPPPPAPKELSEYPALTDDTAWNDDQKLETSTKK